MRAPKAWLGFCLLALTACPASEVDGDEDGFTEDVDCDDTDDGIHPDAVDGCDGVDNNCDDVVDADPCESPYTCENDEDGWATCVLAERNILWIYTWDHLNLNRPTTTGPWGWSEFAALAQGDVTSEEIRLAEDGLTEDKLESQVAVVLHTEGSDGPMTTAQAAALGAWVKGGGALMLVAYEASPASCMFIDSLPAQAGITCASEVAWDGYGVVVDSNHPLTQDVSNVRVGGADSWTALEGTEVLIRGPDDQPILVVNPAVEGGRVVGLADERPLLNAEAGDPCLSTGDHEQLARNLWDWLLP